MTDSQPRRAYVARYLDWMCRFLEDQNEGHLLEIGAADASFASLAARRGFVVHAADIQFEQNPPALNDRLSYLIADAHSLPVASASMCVVAMFDVLEHLRSPFDALTSIRAVLNTGGHLFLSTPNLNSIDRYWHPGSWSGVADPGHRYLFNATSLRHLVTSAGLTVVEIRTPFHALPSTPSRLLERSGLGGQLWLVAKRS